MPRANTQTKIAIPTRYISISYNQGASTAENAG